MSERDCICYLPRGTPMHTHSLTHSLTCAFVRAHVQSIGWDDGVGRTLLRWGGWWGGVNVRGFEGRVRVRLLAVVFLVGWFVRVGFCSFPFCFPVRVPCGLQERCFVVLELLWELPLTTRRRIIWSAFCHCFNLGARLDRACFFWIP